MKGVVGTHFVRWLFTVVVLPQGILKVEPVTGQPHPFILSAYCAADAISADPSPLALLQHARNELGLGDGVEGRQFATPLYAFFRGLGLGHLVGEQLETGTAHVLHVNFFLFGNWKRCVGSETEFVIPM